MPRRIYTYEAGRGWGIWNFVCTIGVAFQVIGTLIFVINILLSLRKGRPAGNDPWDAWTLEWSTSSPPPEHILPKFLPLKVAGRFGTSSTRATRIGNTNDINEHSMNATTATIPFETRRAATGAVPLESSADWSPSKGVVGMTCLIIAESAIFTIFVVAYLYYLGKDLSGPTPRQVLDLPILNSICLLSSSATITFALRSLRNGNTKNSPSVAGNNCAGSLFPVRHRS